MRCHTLDLRSHCLWARPKALAQVGVENHPRHPLASPLQGGQQGVA